MSRQYKNSVVLPLLAFALLWSGLNLTPAFAQPAVRPDASIMNLDALGVYAVGYAYQGQPEHQFPLGWSGHFEERTGISCLPYGEQNGKRVFLLHSPWHGGRGITFQQFVFDLPTQAARILLRGATAMKSDMVTLSDGVTFRLYANGGKVMEYHQTNDAWKPFEFDFTSLRGSKLTVRFEVHPGATNNAAYDYSFWGGRELVLEGYDPPPPAMPAPPPLVLSNVLSAQNGDVAPRSGFAGSSSVQLSNDTVYFRYSGPDGSLEYQWHRPQSVDDLGLFGTLALTAQMIGQAPVYVPMTGTAALNWTQPATVDNSSWVQTGQGYTLLRGYTIGATTAIVRITGQLAGKSLVFSVACDQPLITSLTIGAFGPVVRQREILAPYYSGSAHFLTQENLFTNAFLDWTSSAATNLSGITANYLARTDGTRNRLQERIVYSAAWHLSEVFPNLPNPPSPWREFLSNKVILDSWSGNFVQVTNNLKKLADWGITNVMAIIHVWQRSGFDNALPAHYPANEGLGGDVELVKIFNFCRQLGIRCGLHENYVDYYPNYDFFDGNDISLDSAGNRIKAWFNTSTGIQAFAEKPNAMLRLAATQSPEIHRRYGTNASFLDVQSAVAPWFHVDHRAGEQGSGTFANVWNIHRQLWAYERSVHEGPVFGEGAEHWYWSGYLDGVEAEFRSNGWPVYRGFDAPLDVDFDLLKIHPLQFNHGMGYLGRWWPQGYEASLAGQPPTVVLDQYRMQEVAYGHAGYIEASRISVPAAWLEYLLLGAVAARYATTAPVEILYESGGAWLDATAMAKLGDRVTKNRVRVRYDNGLTLTANGASDTLAVGSWSLPQYGWIAEGAGAKVGTVLRDAIVTDFADVGDWLFVNARSVSDWNLSNFLRIRPSVASFQQTASRSFRVNYQWSVQDSTWRDCRAFVHFVNNKDVILFQQDHSLSPPTSQWQPGQTINDGPYSVSIPATIPDGDYSWLIGLYDEAGRVGLPGVDVGGSRIRLGILRVSNSGANIAFEAETGSGRELPPLLPLYRAHLNETGKVIDFGDLRTDGSAWLRREGDEWVLMPWPRNRRFTLELSSQRFVQPATIRSFGGSAGDIVPVPAGSRWRLPLNDAKEYRWTALNVVSTTTTTTTTTSLSTTTSSTRTTATTTVTTSTSIPSTVIVTTTSTLAATTTTTSTSTTSTTIASPATNLYFPRLVNSGAQLTGHAIVNPGNSAAHLTFTAYENGGSMISAADTGSQAITNPRTRVMSPHSQIAELGYQTFGISLNTAGSWFEVNSDKPGLAGFYLAFDSDLNTMDGADVSRSLLREFVIPESQGAELSLVNPNSQQAIVIFQFIDNQGQAQGSLAATIPSKGRYSRPIAGMFPAAMVNAGGYLRISSTQGLAGIEFFGLPNATVAALNPIEIAGGARVLYSPQYVAAGSTWKSTLTLVNLEDAATTVLLSLIGNNGTPLGLSATVSLPARGRMELSDPSSLGINPDGSEVEGYIRISSDSTRIAGYVRFGDQQDAQFLTALPLVSQGLKDLIYSQVAQNDTYFTGLAVINANADPAGITVAVYDTQGSPLGSGSRTIPANSRISELLPSIVPGLPAVSGGYFRVSSNLPVFSFAVFGTHTLSVLSAVPPQSVSTP